MVIFIASLKSLNLKIVITSCFCLLFSIAMNANIDSLKQIVQSRQDTNAVNAGRSLGNLISNSNVDSSYFYLLNAAHLAEKLGYASGQMACYRSLGGLTPTMGKYEEGLAWLEKGIRIIDSLNMPMRDKVDMLNNIGIAHYTVGFLGKAIEAYIEAVDICREHGLDKQKSRLLNNLGIFYRSLGRHEDAIDIYKQSFELRQENNDSVGMANILFNMSAAYSKLSDHQNAIAKLEEAASIYKALGNELDLAHCAISKGMAYFELKDLANATQQFEIALKTPYKQLQNPFSYNLYIGLAMVNTEQGNTAEAQAFLSKVSEDVISSDYAQQKEKFFELRSELYEKEGKYKQALQDTRAFQELQQEIAKKDKADFRQEMETKYLTSEKEHEIELLNTKNELSELKLGAARKRNIGLGMGLLIFSLLLLWLYKLYRRTKFQKEEISKANKDKEVLLKEIHHRVKNNLQVVSSLLSMQSKFVEDESALAAINTGKTRVNSMSILHRSLYQKDDLKNINVRDYFEELLDSLVSNYQVTDTKINVSKDIEDFELDVDTVMPLGLITNELVSNSLKYAFENQKEGDISLSLKKRNDQVHLCVLDNGSGIPFTEIPSKSKTLGMQLIKSFINKLNADIKISNEGGTKVDITLPAMKVSV